MFHANRWSSAFIAVMGENADEGLVCLRALVPPIRAIPGALFGYADSRKLEKLLLESADASEFSQTCAMYVIRFIVMLVEKNLLRHIDLVMQRIEDQLDRQNGVLAVTAELTSAMEGTFEEELRRQIMEHTGAVQIKLKTRLAPELLGGYRIRIGEFYIDASLKGQMERMKADLETAVLAVPG